jgi:LmbE family N-acetylglucosaminyl deacetylase
LKFGQHLPEHVPEMRQLLFLLCDYTQHVNALQFGSGRQAAAVANLSRHEAVMQKLMAIFAHPDDEGAVAGTLAHYADWGVEVQLVCATRGEVGTISDPALATRATLGAVRQAELIEACDILGVDRIGFLDYRDSGMQGTPENDDPRSFVQADEDEAIGRMVEFIRGWQPDTVITFEPFGWYGHPDHRAACRLATAAFHAAGDADAYRALGAPWQPQALFYAVMPVSRFEEMFAFARENDIDIGGFDQLPMEEMHTTEAQITHKLDVRAYVGRMRAAMMAHRTQFGPNNLFRRLPLDFYERNMGYDHFIQVTPVLKPSAQRPDATTLDAISQED